MTTTTMMTVLTDAVQWTS